MIGFLSKQKVFVILVSFLLCISGVLIFIFSPKESLPEIKLGVILINTFYANSSPYDIEKLVTIPVENAIKNIKGIKSINSISAESISSVSVSLEDNIKDTTQVLNNIKNAVSKINDIPEEVKGPDVTEITTDEFPILQVSISGAKSYSDLRKSTKIIEDRILRIKGVARIEKTGVRDKVIYIDADRKKLNYYSISILSLINAIKSRTFSLPVGYTEIKDKEYSIRTATDIKDINQISDIIIRSNESGETTRIRDVANVFEDFEDQKIDVRTDAQEAIVLTIYKSRGQDTIKINNKIKELINFIKPVMSQDIKVKFFNDSSIFIRDRIHLVNSNGLIGGLFVLAIIIIFINPAVAIQIAASIPIIFGFSLILIKMLGLTYDMLSLFGFVMAIGLIVDNSIVVAENIYRYFIKGLKKEGAIEKGAKEVLIPVFASTLTTIASFLPLVFVGGILGSFLRPIPTVIILTLCVSFFVSYVFLPALINSFIKIHKESKFTVFQEKLIEKIKDIYENLLIKIFKIKYLFIVIVVVVFILSIFLGFKNGFAFFTTQIDEIEIKIKCSPDFSLKDTKKVILDIENKCMSLNTDDLEAVYTLTGRQSGSGGIPEIATNLGQINVVLKIESNRKTKDINKIINYLRDEIKKPEGVEIISIGGVRREGGGSRADVVIDVAGDDLTQVKEVAFKIIDKIKNKKGIKDVFSDFEMGKKEYRIIIDEKNAARAGLNVSSIGVALRTFVSGMEAAKIKIDGEDVKIIIKSTQENYNDITEITNLSIPNNSGRLVPLKNMIKIVEDTGVKAIKRKDAKNNITISAFVDKTITNVAKINTEILKEIKTIEEEYKDVIIQPGGDFKDMMENFKQLGIAFLVAIFIIYIILATLFDSFTQPILIMLAVPFGFIGVMLTLFIHNMPVSFAAFMGFVALSGVVVNNTIILNDFINKLIKETGDFTRAVIESCKIRLRPIILTSLTTAVGLIPVGYGFSGSKDAFLQPVALVFAWGLIFATLVTLFIIPVFIVIWNNLLVRIKMKLGKKSEKDMLIYQ